jgi:hypothetical protein
VRRQDGEIPAHGTLQVSVLVQLRGAFKVALDRRILGRYLSDKYCCKDKEPD